MKDTLKLIATITSVIGLAFVLKQDWYAATIWWNLTGIVLWCVVSED